MIGTTLRYDVVFNKGVGPNLFSPACGVTHSPVSADLVTPGGSGVVGVIDLNHDGRADIVFYFQDPAGLGKISLQLFRGEADGIFFPFPPPSPGQQGLGPVLGVLVTGTAVADFDRDGTPDLLALVTDTNLFAQWYYVVIKSSGGLDFQFAQTLAFPSVRGPVYLGGVTDLNNDGILDVVSMSLSTSPLTFFLGTVGLSFGNGDGTFASVITLPSVNQAAALDVSDANGDGKVDLIVRRQSGTPTTFFGDGAGHFSTTPP
jgi:hypothetical protein